MESNMYSSGPPGWLVALEAAVEELAAQDRAGLPDATRAEGVLRLRRLLDRLEGHWLGELAAVDARGAAGAEQGTQAPSTASWLRSRLHMGAAAANGSLRTARALFRGPLAATAQALTAGELTPAHASVLAAGTQDLAAHTTAEAEPVLLEAARRLDPPRLRRVVAHLRLVADPDAAASKAERHHQRRGLWLAATLEGMVAVDGLLDPEAGQTLLAALEPLAGPASANDARSGGQRRADALTELARRHLEGGRLPQTGGVRPQLTVTVELDSLLGRHGLGGEAGWAGPLDPEACRRLACDGALTRVLVTRHPTHLGGPNDGPGDHGHDHRHDQPSGRLAGHDNPGGHRHKHPSPTTDPSRAHPSSPTQPGGRADPTHHRGHAGIRPAGHSHHAGHAGPTTAASPTDPDGHSHKHPGADGVDRGGQGHLATRLRAAAALLPPVLGGAPTQPLEVGRTSRAVQPAQRVALAVRDGGCVFPACQRPLAWCEAHHLQHWLHGGPTNLTNLALLCRTHHRAVHEGGWRLARGPDGRLTATPPHRRHPAAA